MDCEFEYGGGFSIAIYNVDPGSVEKREDGEGIYINCGIKSNNMDRLFLPLIHFAVNKKPLVVITLPDSLAVAEHYNSGREYYFNFDLIKMINSRYDPSTKIEIILENK